MKIDLIAGARPNFMKIASILDANQNDSHSKLNFRIVHTGQHYDHAMSGSFFAELNIPEPHINLNVGSGSQAVQTAKIMMAYENLLTNEPADLCVVVGDVNSTMACAITAKKKNLMVAHVEAGIRSYDREMPEEINRIITDSISDIFFTTSKSASETLIKEGHTTDKIFFVGNTMVDTLLKHKDKLKKPDCFNILDLRPRQYFVVTLHRPSNVDNQQSLKNLLQNISIAAGDYKVVFPVHPRTRVNLNSLGLDFQNVYLEKPMSYLEFNYLVKNSIGVLTDSGGITEETTVLGVPCITLRDSTERPETCTIGTNLLVGSNPTALLKPMQEIINNTWKKGEVPELWDGKAGQRIIQHLNSFQC